MKSDFKTTRISYFFSLGMTCSLKVLASLRLEVNSYSREATQSYTLLYIRIARAKQRTNVLHSVRVKPKT